MNRHTAKPHAILLFFSLVKCAKNRIIGTIHLLLPTKKKILRIPIPINQINNNYLNIRKRAVYVSKYHLSNRQDNYYDDYRYHSIKHNHLLCAIFPCSKTNIKLYYDCQYIISYCCHIADIPIYIEKKIFNQISIHLTHYCILSFFSFPYIFYSLVIQKIYNNENLIP